MTAITNTMTLDRLDRLAEIVSFVNQHGDKLGQITTIGINTSYAQAQIFSWKVDAKVVAADLIAWFYLLDDPSIDASEAKSIDGAPSVHIELSGRFCGHALKVYCGIYDHDTVAYLLSLPEVSVHALRRVQVGDVPEVVAA